MYVASSFAQVTKLFQKKILTKRALREIKCVRDPAFRIR